MLNLSGCLQPSSTPTSTSLELFGLLEVKSQLILMNQLIAVWMAEDGCELPRNQRLHASDVQIKSGINALFLEVPNEFSWQMNSFEI